MGNCLSNTGNFEPPGSQAVSDFVTQRDQVLSKTAEPRAGGLRDAGAHGPAPVKPKCSICESHVGITVNPWRQTRRELRAAEISDDSEAESDTDDVRAVAGAGAVRRQSRLGKHGIELKPCQHVFCGACLAQSIYRNLNVPFDPSTYGTKLAPASATPPGSKTEFPMGCPTCQVRPGERMVEISDVTARLVLGHKNMDEWNQARFLSTIDICYCPYVDCNEPFDVSDVAPAPIGAPNMKGLVQCPRCKRSLCKDCRVTWHELLACEEFQARPDQERNLTVVNPIDDVGRRRALTPDTRANAVPATQWRNQDPAPNTPLTSNTQLYPGAGPQRPRSAPYPVTTGANSPSTSNRPVIPPRPVLTHYQPESSTNTSRNPQPELASALDAVSRLTAAQQQALVASLTAPGNLAPPPPNVRMSMPVPRIHANEAMHHDDSPDLAAILGVIPHARLNPMERDVLVTTLNNLLAAPNDWTREDIISSPPPYSVIG